MKLDFCHQSLNVALLKSIVISLLLFTNYNGAYTIQEFSSYSYYDNRLHKLQNPVNDAENFGASYESDITIHGDQCNNHNSK